MTLHNLFSPLTFMSIIPRNQVFFFFFLNDPPPPEISPLPLHAALPIYGLVAAGSRDAVNGGQLHDVQQQLNGRMDGLEQRIDGQPQARVAANAAGAPEAPTPPAETPTDRKSTRLNSSHGYISYAVFCLT